MEGNIIGARQGPNADNAQKGAAETEPAVSQETIAIPPLAPESNYGSHHSFAKYAIAAIIIVALLAAAVYFVHVKFGLAPINIATTITATSTTPTAVTSSIPPIVNYSSNQTALFSKILSKANVIYDVPNSSRYSEFSSNTTKAIFGSVNYVEYGYTSSFGLPFTSPFMGINYTPGLNYSFSLPRAYSNATFPIAVGAIIYEYKNSSEINAFYNETAGTPKNSTYYILKNGSISKNKSSEGLPVHYNYNYINVSGSTLRGLVTSATPYYKSLDLSSISLFHNDTAVIVMAYGAADSYDENYTIAIGKHIFESLINNGA